MVFSALFSYFCLSFFPPCFAIVFPPVCLTFPPQTLSISEYTVISQYHDSELKEEMHTLQEMSGQGAKGLPTLWGQMGQTGPKSLRSHFLSLGP